MLWGRPRFTADVDVTARLEPTAVVEFVERMRGAGFTLRADTSHGFVETTRVLPFLHTSTGWPLDVVLAGPGLEETFIARAVEFDLGDGVRVPVMCAEDVIVTKILAGRPKDIDDVRGILAERRTTLDLELVRRTLRMLEEALSVGDLLPAFEAEAARLERR